MSLLQEVNSSRNGDPVAADIAWRRYLIFPSVTLASSKSRDFEIALNRWRAKEYGFLLAPHQGPRRPRASPEVDSLARMQTFLRGGSLSKAWQSISNKQRLAPINDETIAALRELHPEEVGPEAEEPLTHVDGSFEFNTGLLREVFKKLGKLTSPGVHGLRYEHLQLCLREKGDDFLVVLGKFLKILYQGHVPQWVSPFITMGRIVPFLKDTGKIRPIVLPDTMRKLIAKYLLRKTQKRLLTIFENTQYGVCVPSGASALATKLKLAMENEEYDTLLRLDLRNAFNCISRVAIKAALVKFDLEELFPYFQFYYGRPSALVCCTDTLSSSEKWSY